MSNVRLSIQGLLASLTLLPLLLMMCLAGSLTAYLAMVPVLLSLLLGDWRAIAAAFSDRGSQLFVAAFVLLGTAFALSAQQPGDALVVVDFSGFLLFGVALALFTRVAAPSAGRVVADFALLGSVLAVGFGLYQTRILGIERADGGLISIFYSDLGVFLGFLALGGALLPGGRWRWIYAAGPLLGIICGILGQTRASIGAAMVMAIIFAIFALRRWRGRALLIGALIAIAAILVGGAFFASSRAFSGWTAITQLLTSGSADESTNIRLDLYRSGWQAFVDSPIYGHGWARKFSAAQPYMTDPNIIGFSARVSHLHNDALTFAVGAGLLGVLAYLCALAAPLVAVWRSADDSQREFRRYAALVLVLGFFAMGTPDSMFVFELTKTVYCIAAAIIVGFCTDRSRLA